jgi:hypothetical protein
MKILCPGFILEMVTRDLQAVTRARGTAPSSSGLWKLSTFIKVLTGSTIYSE